MIVDTSALLAYFDRNEPMHRAVADVIDDYNGQLVVSPFVIAEVDASNVVLTDFYRTREIATLDHRHFDVLRPLRGGVFSLVP